MNDNTAVYREILLAVARTEALASHDIEWLARFFKRTDPRLKPIEMVAQLYDLSEQLLSNKDKMNVVHLYRARENIRMIFNHMRQTLFPQPNVLVCVPQRRRVLPENAPPPNLGNFVVPQSVQAQAATCFGLGHVEARNHFVERAIKEGRWTHVLFVDDDNLIPLDFVVKALKTRLPIVGAMYIKKLGVLESTATHVVRDDKEVWQQWNVDPVEGEAEPIPVNCLGLGCTLIMVDVFKRVKQMRSPEPVFHWVFDEDDKDPNKRPTVGEDSQFCRDAIACGIQPYLLPNVITPHCSFEESKRDGKPIFYGPHWIVDKKTRDIKAELKNRYTHFICPPGELFAPDNLAADGKDVFGKAANG